jgi:hypothetical protein
MFMSTSIRVICLLLGALVAVTALTACQARARVRPIEAGPAATGPGSTQWVRQQLEGTWTLVSLEMAGADGQLRPTPAAATLTYDAYGNLAVKGTISDPAAASTAGNVLDFTGRAVIDSQRSELRLLDVNQSEGDFATLAPELAAARVRAYEFSGPTMTLRTKNAKGEVRAVIVWRK